MYETFCVENNFPNRLPSFKFTDEQTVPEACGQPNPRVQVKFSASKLNKSLVNFIVDEDLVSIRIC